MKKLLVILMVVFATFALADVNVTYIVNTSTLTGMGATDSTLEVRLCGSEVGPIADGGDTLWENNFMTWDDTSPLAMNAGGDYWTYTIAYPDSMIGWRMALKLRLKWADWEGFDWENNDNRMWVLPATDTTIVAYAQNDFNPPYTPSDSVDIFFRLNISAFEGFNASNPLSFVGNLPVNGSGSTMWSPTTYPLVQEGNSDFYNYHLKLDPSLTPIEYSSVMYRFANGANSGDWNNTEDLQGAYISGNENRAVYIPDHDTTIAWVWWNDLAGGNFGGEDTATVSFTVDMSDAIAKNGFEIGDTLQVRLGYELSSTEVFTVSMTNLTGTQSYIGIANNVPLVFGDYLYYQYYIMKGGIEQREVYYNFNYDGSSVNGAERRRIVISTASASVNDLDGDEASERRMPFFRNNSLLARDVTVHVECDLRPAYAAISVGGKTIANTQGTTTISSISAITGVAMNGPFSNYGEGTWAGWGASLMSDTNRVMYDDGTHGDATAGDTIYTLTYMMSPDSGHTVGQECKFGLNGHDNESGDGAGYGNNHIVNIDDSQAESYLYIPFGSINPTFFSDWTPTPGVGIADLPAEFVLAQNYPNPFNPVTTITFALPTSADVSLNVFDMAGRHVKTLVNGYVNSGSYDVKFDASSLASGVYFYKLTSNDVNIVKKMVLMK